MFPLTRSTVILRHFAHGTHPDAAAVRAAISLPWSNSPVEGQSTASRYSSGRCMIEPASACSKPECSTSREYKGLPASRRTQLHFIKFAVDPIFNAGNPTRYRFIMSLRHALPRAAQLRHSRCWNFYGRDRRGTSRSLVVHQSFHRSHRFGHVIILRKWQQIQHEHHSLELLLNQFITT